MKVQIGLPVKNGARYLSRCLNSLLLQTHTDIEILVSDNASTDDTLPIALEFAGKDERVKVVSEERGDAFGNWTFVLEQATSPAFMWAAHDDVWDHSHISTGLRAIASGYDFYTPNYWVGDIERSQGWQPTRNPFSVFDSRDPLTRLITFINLRHEIQKDMAIYSLFRTDAVHRALSPYLPTFRNNLSSSFTGMWCSLVFLTLNGLTSDVVQFFKQSTWHASRPPTAIAVNETRFESNRRAYSWLKEVMGRNAGGKSVSMTPDGLAQYVAHYPEIAATILHTFQNQNQETDALFMIDDTDALQRTARKELDAWLSLSSPHTLALRPAGVLSRLYRQ